MSWKFLWANALALLAAGCHRDPGPLGLYFSGEPVSHWLETARSPDPKARKKAVDVLGNVGPADPAVIPALVAAVKDKDPAVRDRIIGQFVKAAEASAAAGAEVVIAAVGVAMALIAEAGIHTVGQGTPVLNGIVSLVKMGEAAVRLNGIMKGGFVSRRATYAQPPGDQIAELRRFYGDVYPRVTPS